MALVPLMSVAACSDDETPSSDSGALPSRPSDEGRADAIAATSTTRSITTTAVQPRPPFPNSDAPCDETAIPFRTPTLPDGIDPTPILYEEWVEAMTPEGHDQVRELYDPVYLLLDATTSERRIEIFHGNSWRLASVLREEIVVLEATAWLSDLPDGGVVIDFRVDDADEPCAYWALRNVGLSENDLRATASALAAA